MVNRWGNHFMLLLWMSQWGKVSHCCSEQPVYRNMFDENANKMTKIVYGEVFTVHFFCIMILDYGSLICCFSGSVILREVVCEWTFNTCVTCLQCTVLLGGQDLTTQLEALCFGADWINREQQWFCWWGSLSCWRNHVNDCLFSSVSAFSCWDFAKSDSPQCSTIQPCCGLNVCPPSPLGQCHWCLPASRLLCWWLFAPTRGLRFFWGICLQHPWLCSLIYSLFPRSLRHTAGLNGHWTRRVSILPWCGEL